QFRMRLGGLGGDRDIGAVARGAQRNREANAAARSRDEQRLAFERRHVVLPMALVGWAKRSVPTIRSEARIGGHGASAPLPALRPHCTAASEPRVRGSGAPSNPFGVTAIEFAEVYPIDSPTAWPFSFSAASTSGAKPGSTFTSSGIH